MKDSIQFFGAEIDDRISVIDLHDTGNIPDALEKMERELYEVYNSGERYCRVIHGIGEGKLANAVHKNLEKNPMVGEWKCEGGSCIILF